MGDSQFDTMQPLDDGFPEPATGDVLTDMKYLLSHAGDAVVPVGYKELELWIEGVEADRETLAERDELIKVLYRKVDGGVADRRARASMERILAVHEHNKAARKIARIAVSIEHMLSRQRGRIAEMASEECDFVNTGAHRKTCTEHEMYEAYALTTWCRRCDDRRNGRLQARMYSCDGRIRKAKAKLADLVDRMAFPDRSRT